MFEENIRGTAVELRTHFEQIPPKGEIVVVVEGTGKNAAYKEDRDEESE